MSRTERDAFPTLIMSDRKRSPNPRGLFPYLKRGAGHGHVLCGHVGVSGPEGWLVKPDPEEQSSHLGARGWGTGEGSVEGP